MGNKTTALLRTPTKIIINMNLAIEALGEDQVKNLHDIIASLKTYDERKLGK